MHKKYKFPNVNAEIVNIKLMHDTAVNEISQRIYHKPTFWLEPQGLLFADNQILFFISSNKHLTTILPHPYVKQTTHLSLGLLTSVENLYLFFLCKILNSKYTPRRGLVTMAGHIVCFVKYQILAGADRQSRGT